LKTLEDNDATVVENLILELGDPRKAVQRRAIDELAAIAAAGNPIVAEKLRDAVASADRRVRWAAAYALAHVGAGAFAMDSADALCEAMSDDDGDIRWAATNLMVQLGRENLAEIGACLLKLAVDRDRNARKMALYCIRDLEIAGPDLLIVVERAVRDPDVHVRLAALSVLAKLRDASGEAVRIMLESLKSDPDAGVRRAAASAFGNLESASADATAALTSAAADSGDKSLARAARGALDRLEKVRLKKIGMEKL
jgi:HEAT repeat protein